MTYQELKKVGDLSLTEEGKIALRPYTKLTKKQQENISNFITKNRQDIIQQLTNEANEREALRQAEEETAKHTVSVHLSSRGMGDYQPVCVDIDVRKSESEWLESARNALDKAHDVDSPNQTDEELLEKINTAIANDAEKAARRIEYHKTLKETEIPGEAIEAYHRYKGSSEKAWEAGDDAAYALIDIWDKYIEAQGRGM